MSMPIRALFALGVLLAGSHALQAQTTLKYQFRKGDTLHYVQTVAQKGSSKGGGMDFSGGQKQTIETTWRVDSVDDKGNARIALKVDRAKLAAESAKESREVSSDATDEPADKVGKSMYTLARVLAKMEGTFTVSPRGEVDKVNVPESVAKAMQAVPGADKLPESSPEDNLTTTLTESLFVLPANAIAKGTTWKNPVKGRSPFGKLTGEVQFSYEGGVQRDGRRLEKFLVKPKLKIETDPAGDVVFTVKLYESSGVVYFDNAAGRLVELTNTLRIEVDAEAMGKKFSQKTETTSSFKMVKASR
jgi:hypothetical protein